MNARGLRHYIDDLLRGRRPKPFAPDDFEAAQIRTAIGCGSSHLRLPKGRHTGGTP